MANDIIAGLYSKLFEIYEEIYRYKNSLRYKISPVFAQ